MKRLRMIAELIAKRCDVNKCPLGESCYKKCYDEECICSITNWMKAIIDRW